MAATTYDVEITIRRTVRVKFDISDPALVENDECPEEVAAEFADGGRALWPVYVISEEEDREVESVTKVAAHQRKTRKAG